LIQPWSCYDTVEISGAGFLDWGVRNNDRSLVIVSNPGQRNMTIQPPSAQADKCKMNTTIVVDGKSVNQTSEDPLGSYTEERAKKKYKNTKNIFNLIVDHDSPFLTPYPIATIKYPGIPDGKGGCQTALVTICPAKGQRMSDPIINFLNFLDEISEIEERSKQFRLLYPKLFFDVLVRLGQSTRFLHDYNLCHYQITLGNVSPPLNGFRDGPTRICLYDWSTLEQTDTTDPSLARATDMAGPLISVTAVLDGFYRVNHIPLDIIASMGYSSTLHYLAGYYYIDPRQLERRLALSQDERVDLSLVKNEEIAPFLKTRIFPLVE